MNIWQYRTVVHQRAVTLTNSQIRTLTDTGGEQTVIPAPGAGRIILPLSVGLFAHFPTPYNALNASDALVFSYVKNDGLAQVTRLVNAGAHSSLNIFLTNSYGSTDHYTQLLVPLSWYDTVEEINVSYTLTQPLDSITNKPLLVNLDASSLTGGSSSNTLTIAVLYHVYDLYKKEYLP